jgi:hypothetical protein
MYPPVRQSQPTEVCVSTQHLESEPSQAPTSSVLSWPTRVAGDPTTWMRGDVYAEVCPVHEHLLHDGYCEKCAAPGGTEMSL